MTVLVEDLLSLARLDEGRGINITQQVKLTSVVRDAAGGSLRRFGELASRSKPPLSNRGVLLQRTREKINTKLLICNDL